MSTCAKKVYHRRFRDEYRSDIICNALKVRVISTGIHADVGSSFQPQRR